MSSQLPAYIGRTIDVLAFRGGTQYGRTLLTQSLADENSTGEICTGLQKLGQRFLLTLLTETGSIKRLPTYGTNFMISVAQGRVHNETDMRAIFGLALQQLQPQMLDEETDNDPDDERYGGAELGTIVINQGYVELTITLKSRSTSAQIILPIPIVV